MIYLDKPDVWNPAFEAVGCFIEYKGEIFLLHRLDHKPEGNTWCAPGGKVDLGESTLVAIVREIRQETGFEITEEQIQYIKEVYVRYEDLDFVYHIFRAELLQRQKSVINRSEHKDSCWVSPKKALSLPLIQDEDACIRMVYTL